MFCWLLAALAESVPAIVLLLSASQLIQLLMASICRPFLGLILTHQDWSSGLICEQRQEFPKMFLWMLLFCMPPSICLCYVTEWAKQLQLNWVVIWGQKSSCCCFFSSPICSRILVNILPRFWLSGLDIKEGFVLWLLIKCVYVPVKLKINRSHAPECKLNAEEFRKRIHLSYPACYCMIS